MFEFDALKVRLGVVLVIELTDSVDADATPSVGVTSVGDVDSTTLPEPVDVMTPVPPFVTGRVPVTPVVSGRPEALVSVIDDGIPKAGATSVGDVDSTTLPEPVGDPLVIDMIWP